MTLRVTPHDQSVLEAVADRAGSIVARAAAWAGVSSGSYNLSGLETMAAILAEAFAVLPATLTRHPMPPIAEIAADGRSSPRAQGQALEYVVRPEAAVQVVLTGHYDTVFAADTGFLSVATRGDGALNGPGIADMKGGISVMLAALEAFETHPAAASLGYAVLLSPDEEIGSPGSAPLLARLAARGQVGMTYEPTMPDGALASARKGSGNFHIVVSGRAAHAGRDFAQGRNAVVEAARLALTLDGLNGRLDGVTVNVARIDGGAPLNMVAASAVVRFNIRGPDEAACLSARAAIDDILAAPRGGGLSVALHGGFTRPPKPFSPAQQRLFAALAEVGALIDLPIAWRASGGVCEGNNLFAAGLPNIDTLGVRGGDIHSEAEYAWPDSFAERARLSALLLIKLADGGIDAAAIRALATPT